MNEVMISLPCIKAGINFDDKFLSVFVMHKDSLKLLVG